ncbi:MAG TPA: AcvB/VirJ family lysyl-phosphatidylglycerol hydrolase [Candidatus Saccharimonadales bacterium]|nr:AcvB/VirJ family lysyl-phosphatidylglycerol hydrolase [Candidatus Saccharimonadales bacterium]
MPGEPSSGRALVFFASGDGGWAGLVKRVAKDLAGKGYPVVGLNSLSYLWHSKDPDRAARDLERTLRHYLDAWKKSEIVLVGYSSGADILPFMATRLPDDLRARVRLVVLVGPGEQAAFEFHFRDWFGMTPKGVQYPILPEIQRLSGKMVVCVSGAEEDGGLCPTLPTQLATVVTLPGGHHVDGDYDRLAEIVIENLPAEK